jgi:ankyrin repeat protein
MLKDCALIVILLTIGSLQGMEKFLPSSSKRKRSEGEELFKAIETNTVAEVEHYLTNGGNPDIRDSLLKTLLHHAALHNRLRIARLLLTHHASRTIQDTYKMTPLHWAVLCGHEQLVAALVCFDVLMIKDNRGLTPLHQAVYRGNHILVTLLLAQGASPNTYAQDGCTPLHDAALNGHHEIVQALLDHQAGARYQDSHFWTPLHYAALYNHLEVVRALLPHCTHDAMVNNDGKTPLHVAITAPRTSLDVIRLLLTKKEWLNALDNNRETPLHYAAHLGLDAAVEELLKHNAQVFVLNKQKQTPCDLARERKHEKIISLLEEQSSPVLF